MKIVKPGQLYCYDCGEKISGIQNAKYCYECKDRRINDWRRKVKKISKK